MVAGAASGLCNSFPTLFDLVDESSTMEVDGVDKKDYWSVVDQCYLCDLCYLTKCPYVPPHEWNVDYPHLMLRAKASGTSRAARRCAIGCSPRPIASVRIASIPVVAEVVNATNTLKPARKLMEKTLGVHATPSFAGRSACRQKNCVSADRGGNGLAETLALHRARSVPARARPVSSACSHDEEQTLRICISPLQR